MQQVVSYWNSVDETLELDLDVLDDLTGEAAEVCAASRNPWLSYGAPLHRLREFGSCIKLLDLLDEKRLSAAEMKDLIEIILGAVASDLPHPDIDWQSFQASARCVDATAYLLALEMRAGTACLRVGWPKMSNHKRPARCRHECGSCTGPL